MKPTSVTVWAFALLVCAVGVAEAGGMEEMKMDSGNLNPELLVAQCVVCHGQDGNSVKETPKLNGLDEETIVTMMTAFKKANLDGTVMPRFAKGFTNAQIEVIAAELASN